MQLSISIITLNEEKNIARCLESVKDIANEIIVVDSFSTDKTEAICKQYGAKFIQQKFLGYMEQKHFAVECCKYDFVLCLDADEALSDQLLCEIKKEKQSGFQYDSYIMKRCTNFCGKWIKYGSWYPDKKLRLFNKQNGKWGGPTIHESVRMNEGATTLLLKGDLLHYSFYSIEEVLIQQNKFTTIQAKAMFDAGKRANFVKLCINPIIAFINGFIFKLGFLNGVDGFFIAKTISYYTFIKYYKLMRLEKSN